MTYAIVKKHNYYSGTFNVDSNWHLQLFDHYWTYEDKPAGLNEDCYSFNSKVDAEKALKELDSGVYYLRHGEYSRPT